MGITLDFRPARHSDPLPPGPRGQLLSFRPEFSHAKKRRSRIRVMAAGALAWIGVWLALFIAAGATLFGSTDTRDRAHEQPPPRRGLSRAQ